MSVRDLGRLLQCQARIQAQAPRITLAASQALIMIAMREIRGERALTNSQIARAIGLSHSGASRVVISLSTTSRKRGESEKDGYGFVEDAAHGITLTDKGRMLVKDLVAILQS